mmetsp:Transcript_23970/g.26484  ORF Transcript_23970/g.26484 Transcript_23970/m.26484 type:complete len:99 (+) Transcript_23970:155-451(+)
MPAQPRIAKDYVECDQHEKAYQSQDAVFVARKRTVGNLRQKPMRYVKNVGLGIKTPFAAIEGSYVDKKMSFYWKCFHSRTYLERFSYLNENETNNYRT